MPLETPIASDCFERPSKAAEAVTAKEEVAVLIGGVFWRSLFWGSVFWGSVFWGSVFWGSVLWGSLQGKATG
jgi:hypothetical protein